MPEPVRHRSHDRGAARTHRAPPRASADNHTRRRTSMSTCPVPAGPCPIHGSGGSEGPFSQRPDNLPPPQLLAERGPTQPPVAGVGGGIVARTESTTSEHSRVRLPSASPNGSRARRVYRPVSPRVVVHPFSVMVAARWRPCSQATKAPSSFQAVRAVRRRGRTRPKSSLVRGWKSILQVSLTGSELCTGTPTAYTPDKAAHRVPFDLHLRRVQSQECIALSASHVCDLTGPVTTSLQGPRRGCSSAAAIEDVDHWRTVARQL